RCLSLAAHHNVDLLALEERDADRAAVLDGLLGVAAAENDAMFASMLDQLADVQAVIGHIVGPIDLHEVKAEVGAVHEEQAQVGQSIEADAVAALAGEVANIEIAAEISEDVDLVELDHDGAANHAADAGVEGLELRRQ